MGMLKFECEDCGEELFKQELIWKEIQVEPGKTVKKGRCQNCYGPVNVKETADG